MLVFLQKIKNGAVLPTTGHPIKAELWYVMEVGNGIRVGYAWFKKGCRSFIREHPTQNQKDERDFKPL